MTIWKLLQMVNWSDHTPKWLFVIYDPETEFGELIKIIT